MPIRLLLTAICALALTTLAAADQREAAIAARLDAVAAALRADDAEALAGFLDTGRLLALGADLVGEPLPESFTTPQSLVVIEEQVAEHLAANPFLDWSAHELVAVTGDAEQAQATLRVRTLQGSDGFYRFWLEAHGAEWQVVDFTDAELGMRLSLLMAIGLHHAEDEVPWMEAAAAMAATFPAVAEGDYRAAREFLAAHPEPFGPAALHPAYLSLALSVAIADEDFARAHELLPRVDALDERAPIFDYLAAELALAEDAYPRAVARLAAYEAMVGTYADSEWLRGRILAESGERAAAVAAFTRALEINPEHEDALWELALALDPTEQARTWAATTATAEPLATFRWLAEELALAGEFARLAAYAAPAHAAHPDDFDVTWYYADALAQTGAVAEAVAVLDRSLAIDPPIGDPAHDPARIDAAVLRANLLAEHEGVLAAYARAGVWQRPVFEVLADRAIAAEDLDLLAELVARHAAADGQDPWLPYYRAEAHRLRGEHDAAESAYAAGMQTELSQRAYYWYLRQRVTNLAEAGRPGDALTLAAGDRATRLGILLELADRLPPEPLIAVLEAELRARPDDAGIALALAEVLRRSGDHARALALVRERVPTAGLDYTGLWRRDEILVRSALASDELAAARAAATASTARDGDPYYELVVAAAAGERTTALQLAEELVELGYLAERLADDPDVGATLRAWFVEAGLLSAE